MTIDTQQDSRIIYLKKILKNENLLINLTKNNLFEYLKVLISSIEKLLYKEDTFPRQMGEYQFKMRNNNSDFQIVEVKSNNEIIIVFESKFEGREIDIEKIKGVISKNYPSINPDELKRIKLLYSDLFVEGSYVSIFADEDRILDTYKYLTSITNKSLELNIGDIETIESILDYIFNSEYAWVLKIGLFNIISHYESLENYFKKRIIFNKNFEYIVRYYIFGDELRRLFEKVISLTNEEEIRIDALIKKGEYIVRDYDDEITPLLWAQKRYHALRNIENFNIKYKQLKNKTKVESELVAPFSSSGVHSITQKSPISEGEISNMSSKDLYNYIKRFSPKDNFHDFVEISYEGLGEEISSFFKSNPKIFKDYYLDLIKVPYEITTSIINGQGDALDKETDIISILDYIKVNISDDYFWVNKYTSENTNRAYSFEAALSSFLRFIRQYLSNDKVNFNLDIYSEIYTILVIINEKHNLSAIDEVLYGNNDFGFYTINSIGGKYALVLLELALKIKRINMAKYESKWKSDLSKLYETLLLKQSIDGFFILGEYMSLFSYLDKEWLVAQIEKRNLSKITWTFFISGFVYSRTLIGEYYILLSSDIIKAIEYDFPDKNIKERLIYNIVFAYLNDYEIDIENKPLQKLISMWDTTYMIQVVHACYSVRDRKFRDDIDINQVLKKIMDIWSMIRERYSVAIEINEAERNLIQSTVRLVHNFEKLTSIMEANIRFLFTYLKGSYDEYHIVEFFRKLIDTKEYYNLESFLSLIKDFYIFILPSYPIETILELLDFLYEKRKFKYIDDIKKKLYETKNRF